MDFVLHARVAPTTPSFLRLRGSPREREKHRTRAVPAGPVPFFSRPLLRWSSLAVIHCLVSVSLQHPFVAPKHLHQIVLGRTPSASTAVTELRTLPKMNQSTHRTHGVGQCVPPPHTHTDASSSTVPPSTPRRFCPTVNLPTSNFPAHDTGGSSSNALSTFRLAWPCAGRDDADPQEVHSAGSAHVHPPVPVVQGGNADVEGVLRCHLRQGSPGDHGEAGRRPGHVLREFYIYLLVENVVCLVLSAWNETSIAHPVLHHPRPFHQDRLPGGVTSSRASHFRSKRFASPELPPVEFVYPVPPRLMMLSFCRT